MQFNLRRRLFFPNRFRPVQNSQTQNSTPEDWQNAKVDYFRRIYEIDHDEL